MITLYTQMEGHRARHTTHEEDPHMHDQDVGLQLGHNDEHHGEKTSVLKKVKAKAKKIKDTIKEHVGHGHELHDEGDEMDVDPEIHGTHNAQSFMPGQEGVARQHMHEPKLGERTAGGAQVMSRPGDYQTFDPTTARYTPGQDETLDWSRTDTRTPRESEDNPCAPKNTPVDMHSGSHSTGALDIGKRGAPVKLGAVVGRPTGMENDLQALKDVEDRHFPNYQAKVMDPTSTGYDSVAGQSFMPGLHGGKVGERTAMEGVVHAPASKLQGDYQTFDPSTANYVTGQEKSLGWSRTDTGRLHGAEELSDSLNNTPMAAHSVAQSYTPGPHKNEVGQRAAMEGLIHAPASKLHCDYQTLDPSTTSYVPGQEETLGWTRTDTGRLHGSEEQSNASKYTPTAAHSGYNSSVSKSFMPGLHRTEMGERTATDAPTSKLQGDYQNFEPTTRSYVPGQEETLGWSRTDIGRLNGSESKNLPSAAHAGKIHGMRAEEESGTGKLGGLLENPGRLEKDPHAPRDPREKRHAEHYESKVTDPTGKGGEETGVTPILHQLDKMNIYDESQQKPRTGEHEKLFRTEYSPQDQKISTGSHDQFYPEPDTSKMSTFQKANSPGTEGSHDMLEQKQGSYTSKISSAAAMMADKAKQATSSVTSKLGYGGSSDQHPTVASSGMYEKQPEPGTYGEKISAIPSAIADKAAQAKDVVATKLGFGGTPEGQPMQEGASKGGSIVGAAKEKIAPVYGKVAEVGSSMASKVQSPRTEHELDSTTTTGPTAETDKGVSMKEYLVEKLKPGEEDKALSKVITEALPLHKRKEDVSNTGEDGEGKGEGRKVTIIGRVTESEEVARQLGRSEETNYDDAGTGMASPGKGVMDRIKDAATSWFQKSGESLPSDTAEGNEGPLNISSMDSEQKRAGDPRSQY